MADLYLTAANFSSQSGIMPYVSSVVSATGGQFFSIILFLLLIFLPGASYFLILKTTGKKRYWHSLTAISLVNFFLSLFLISMNTATVVFLKPYWVIFYIGTTVASFFMLMNYK